MGDDFGACLEHHARVFQIVDMHRYGQSAAGGKVHQGLEHLRHQGRQLAEFGVDPRLDEIGAEIGIGVQLAADFRQIVAVNRAAGDIQPRPVEPGMKLLVAHLKARRFVAAEAEHRGDAVTRVEAKLVEYVFATVMAGFQAQRVADVAVSVDHAGHDRLAADIDAFGIRGNAHFGSRADAAHAPIGNDEHTVRQRRGCGAVYDRGAGEGDAALVCGNVSTKEN